MKLKIVYNKWHVDKPILSCVVLKIGMPLNIIEAHVSPTGGEVVIDVPKDEYVGKVVEAFREEGVLVKELTKNVEVEASKCIACGACISPCPVGAIKLSQDTITIDDVKCVRCEACVYACPLRAIRLL